MKKYTILGIIIAVLALFAALYFGTAKQEQGKVEPQVLEDVKAKEKARDDFFDMSDMDTTPNEDPF